MVVTINQVDERYFRKMGMPDFSSLSSEAGPRIDILDGKTSLNSETNRHGWSIGREGGNKVMSCMRIHRAQANG